MSTTAPSTATSSVCARSSRWSIPSSRRSKPCMALDIVTAITDPAAAAGSVIAVTISNAIQGFDLRELGIDHLELLAQTLDVAVDGAVVDIDVLAVSTVHQLVATLDVAGPHGERFEDQKLGYREIDILAAPGALMPSRIERQIAALDDRLGFGGLLATRDLAPAQQRADALDQQALRERLLDVVVRAHTQAENLIHLVVLRRQEDHWHRALLAQMAEELHAVHARHLDVEDGEIGGLRRQTLECFRTVGIATHGKALRLEGHR